MNTPADSNATQDRRQYHRVRFDTGAELAFEGNTWPCEVLDLSLKGALIRPIEELSLPEGAEVTLQVNLGDDASIKMDATLAHCAEDQLGFRCDSIDLESISHLRRLVELNLGDASLAERDLAHLASP